MTFPWSLRRTASGGIGPDAEPEAPDNEKVARFWSRQAGQWGIGGARHWTELPQVHEIINRRVSGDPAVDPYLHLLRSRLADRLPVDRALTIGCGGGDLERGLCQYGFAREHDAVDVAPGAIEKAIAAAARDGLAHLRYRVADGNALELEPGSLDVVFGVHSIHHISRLEAVFRQVARALRPGGIFFMNEFVGPTRFQWSDRQLEVVNALLRVLPEPLRVSATDGRLKTWVKRPTIEEMIAADPSEAIRSAEIIEIAADFFEVQEVRPYGGTVLQILLDDIAGNFARPDTGGPEILEAIAAIEWALIGTGELNTDFAVIVATARP